MSARTEKPVMVYPSQTETPSVLHPSLTETPNVVHTSYEEVHSVVNTNHPETLAMVYTSHPVRWYVLCLVSMTNILNNYLWGSWGPISQSAKLVYGWTDNQLLWIVNYGNIAGFLATLIGCYLVDKKGIRVATLACTFLLVLSTTSRIITMETEIATILISIGQTISGAATSITTCIPPAVSEVWFRVDERNTATAIGMLASVLGVASAFLLGPLMVSMPSMNGSVVLVNETDIGLIKKQIRDLNYISFGVSILLLVSCVVYLPAKPSTSPSKSASVTRYDFLQGVKLIFRNRSVWYISSIYAIPNGFYGSFISVIDVILNPLGISQTTAGWMGFYSSIAGVIGGLIVGRFADKFMRKSKLIIVINYTLASISLVWFACMINNILPRSKALLYIAFILPGAFTNSCIPLFIEITCEIAHPIAEGVTAGFLGMVLIFWMAVFLLIQQVANLGTLWLIWTVCGVYIVSIPLMAVYKVHYRRVDIDTGDVTVDVTTQDVKQHLIGQHISHVTQHTQYGTLQ